MTLFFVEQKLSNENNLWTDF